MRSSPRLLLGCAVLLACSADGRDAALDASAASDAGGASDAGDAADAGDAGDAFGPARIVALPPTIIGALAGPFSTRAADQTSAPFFGTDLGVSFTHGGAIRILFGDTWVDEISTTISPAFDDAQASISLAVSGGVPDGDAVDAFDAARDDAAQPAWKRSAPPLRFELSDAGTLAPIELYREGDAERPIDLSIGKAVVAGFSDGAQGAFAIFRRDVAVECSGGATPSCDEAFVCDTAMGFCAETAGLLYPQPCVLGTARCVCELSAGGGLCQDRTSSMYKAGDEDGRLESLVIEHEVGCADPDRPTRYATVPFRTNKLTNAIAKTVTDFDPERAEPDENDYALPRAAPTGREKVLLWGRPHSVGSGAVGRDARLYFAFSDMPEATEQGPRGFAPQYFAGLDGQRPMFSPSSADAVALDVGGAPLPEHERYDVVDRTAVSYLPSLQTWVMLYGGDFSAPVLRTFVGPNYGLVERAPTGAIHARFARHPWGPWSEPQPVLEAGDPSLDPLDESSQYASGGILHHTRCTGADCAPGAPAVIFIVAPDGFLYAPNIFDAFTEVREDGAAVDIYWNVSTWNPYQVMLLRTRLRRER